MPISNTDLFIALLHPKLLGFFLPPPPLHVYYFMHWVSHFIHSFFFHSLCLLPLYMYGCSSPFPVLFTSVSLWLLKPRLYFNCYSQLYKPCSFTLHSLQYISKLKLSLPFHAAVIICAVSIHFTPYIHAILLNDHLATKAEIHFTHKRQFTCRLSSSWRFISISFSNCSCFSFI